MAASAAFAQRANSPIAFSNQDAIVTTLVTAPSLGGMGGSSAAGANTQWLKIEFHYSITPPPDAAQFVDAVQFKVWVEGLDPLAPNPTQPNGKGVAVGLTGDVTYINIAANKDCYGVFYVHPSTLARYSGDRGSDDYVRKYDVHLQALVGGTLMDEIDKFQGKETDKAWYQKLRPVTNLVLRQNQCPFLIADPDRYPAIQLAPPGGQ